MPIARRASTCVFDRTTVPASAAKVELCTTTGYRIERDPSLPSTRSEAARAGAAPNGSRDLRPRIFDEEIVLLFASLERRRVEVTEPDERSTGASGQESGGRGLPRQARRAGDGQPGHAHPGFALRGVRAGRGAAHRIARRLEIRYTPKHGSWLYMGDRDRRHGPAVPGPAEPGCVVCPDFPILGPTLSRIRATIRLKRSRKDCG